MSSLRNILRRWAFAMLILGGLVSLGCASNGPRAGDGASLKERVQAYWVARETGDDKTVYAMESAARPGGWLTLIVASQRGLGLPVGKVEIGDIHVDGESAEAQISADVRVGSLRPIRSTIVDRWVQIEGVWYHRTPDR